MQVMLYELSGKTSACVIRRGVNYDLVRKDMDHIKRSAAIIREIREIEFGTVSAANLEDRLKEVFEEIQYASDIQRQIQLEMALAQINRYIGSEKRKLYPAKAMDIDLGQGLVTSNAAPHAITWETGKKGEKILHLIRYKAKKPDLSQKRAGNSLELYAMLKYGRKMVAPLETVIINASIYFLRKQDDSYGATPKFEPDFFNIKGGRNIVSLAEEYTAPLIGEGTTDLDRHFKKIVAEFIAGIPEESCSASDCEKCDFQPICKFSNPPMALPAAAVSRTVRSIRLSPDQRLIKNFEKGFARVNAGAGSGKTMSIVIRVISLLNKGVLPEEILLITFTNVGAKEIRERIRLYAEDDGIADEVDIDKIMIMTFNAFGYEIIKNEYKKLGLPEAPIMVEDVDRFKTVAKMLNATQVKGLDYRNFDMNEFNVKGAVAVASAAFELFKKNPMLGLSDIDTLYEKFEAYHSFCPKDTLVELYRLFRGYDQALRDESLIEFADQEGMLFELLEMEPYYLEKFGLKHIIVDEAQDSSESQIKLVKLLSSCPSWQSTMFVGDVSQAIYSFRDTSPDYMINLDKILGTKIVDINLLDNYRSTPQIIEFANAIDRLNVNRIEKDLISRRPDGPPVFVQGFLTADDERAWIINKIQERLGDGVKPENIAVLARNKTELNKIADLLAEAHIPSVIQFPEKLMNVSLIQAALAMMKAIRDPDDTLSLLIYGNALVGGRLKNSTAAEKDAARDLALAKVNDYRALTTEEDKHKAIDAMFHEMDPDEKDSLYQQFIESVLLRPTQRMLEYGSDFERFGQNQTLRRAGNYPGVVLSTAHSSKGLEWPVVFNMIGGYDKQELHKAGSKTTSRVEEERRLLYVSSTRARDELIITAPYTCGGRAGDYTYNRFLIDCYRVIGKEFNTEEIEKERLARKQLEKATREEEKKKEAESADALAS